MQNFSNTLPILQYYIAKLVNYYTLYHFENGCDITIHLRLGHSEMHTLLSVRGKILVRLQRDATEALSCCRDATVV